MKATPNEGQGWLQLVTLAALLAAACGPRAVQSPDWILSDPQRYPSARFLTGVGSAPTSGGLADAMKAAAAGARAELAKTIEVHVEHVQQLAGRTVEGRENGGAAMALEAERSELSSFTQESTEQIVQGIELKEKYHDPDRGVLYVLAVLDKQKASLRLAEELHEADERAAQSARRAAAAAAAGDALIAMRQYRQALRQALQAQVMLDQLRVVNPQRARAVALEQDSGSLADRLSQLLLGYGFRVSVEGYPLIANSMYEALVDAGFDARSAASPETPGLTLWGDVNVKRGTALGPGGGEELQVCRTYLSIKLVDDRSGRIVGQVNLLDNSNAETGALAEERALRLLRQRILRELPASLYRALSMEEE